MQTKISEVEVDRTIEEARIDEELQTIQEAIESARSSKLNRSNAPSPEPQSTESTVVQPSVPDYALCREQLSTIHAPLPQRHPCSTRFNLQVKAKTAITDSATTQISPQIPDRKIFWKVKPNLSLNINNHIPSAVSTSAPATKPIPRKRKVAMLSDKYEWEEYDHTEVFEEPDNEEDSDYVPREED